jgi:hypothetical protein
MSSERLVWQGQKQEKLQQAKKLELSISGLRDSIRTGLNPHVSISEINQELACGQVFELSEKLIQYRKITAEIIAINESLGLA